MKNFFVDAETDGLYGNFLSVAAVVENEAGEELDRFYASVSCSKEELQSDWVKENVFPYLWQAETECKDEGSLLDAFWSFWMRYRDEAQCIAYVQYPVECRLFSTCVNRNLSEREFLGPYPIYDLSTLLYAKGYDMMNVDMEELTGLQLIQHDALNDVRMMAEAWKRLQ